MEPNGPHEDERRAFFEQMLDAYALHDVVRDATGGPIDYRYVEVNPAFEQITGRPAREVVGKTVREVFPELEPEWFEAFEQVVREGTPLRFTCYTKALDKFLEVSLYRPRPESYAIAFQDVTPREIAKQALEGTARQLRRALTGTVDMMGRTTEIRDPYTAGHQRRVAQLARAIAVQLELGQELTRVVYLGALAHDIGKIAVPSEILNRPGQLEPNQYQLVKTHPQIGATILNAVEFPWPLADIVHQHHERMDGSGYPEGLKGDEIRLEARIVTVADVVESMNSYRPYRAILPPLAGLHEIRRHRGVLYDPAVTDACLAVFDAGFDFEEVKIPTLN